MIGQHLSTPARFSARQRYLVSLADQLGERFAQLDSDGEAQRQRHADLQASGFIRLVVPTEHGGHSASAFDAALLLEHLARGDVETASALLPMLQLMGWLAETNAVSAPLFLAMCRTITASGALIYPALEDELGAAPHEPAPLRARPGDAGWLLDGEVRFLRTSLRPDYVLAPVVVADGAGQPPEQSAVLIPVDLAQAYRGGWLESSGADQHHSVSLRQYLVPQQHLTRRLIIGGRQQQESALTRLAWQHLTLAAVYLGATQGAWTGVERALARRVGELLLPDAAALGSILVSLTGARTILYHAAQAWVTQPLERPEALTQVVTARALCAQAAASVLEQTRALPDAGPHAALALERSLQRLRQHQGQDQGAVLRMIGRAALGTSVAA